MLLAVLTGMVGGALGAAPAQAAPAASPTVSVSTYAGDELTAFRGSGSGFTANASVNVTVRVNGSPYAGAYTKTHQAGASGAFDWVWVWSNGDPFGTYTLTFTDTVSHASVNVTLAIKHTATGPTPAAGTHLMVDTGSAPALATVQAWQRSAPYDAIGVYVPVDPSADNRHDKVQSNLTQPWVTAVLEGGWHVVPIYVGLQAPTACETGSFHAMASDAETAQSQGADAAGEAVGEANNLGIDAALPVVYDLEAYTTGCSTAVQAFLLGWTTELHALNRTAGVYGVPKSAAHDLTDAAAADPTYVLPDLFWAATNNRRAAVNSVSDLPAATWKVANQYIFDVTRTYGATSLTVDETAVDSTVWSSTRSDPPPDTTAPIVAMGNAPDLIRTGTTSFAWSGVDAGSGIASYQLRTRHTAGGHAAGVWSAPASMPPSTRASTAVKIRRGEQVCAQVRAVDAAGNASDWTFADCTSRLDDDRSAKPGAGWHRGHARAAYRRTVTTGKRSHAVLNLGRTAGGRLAVTMSGRGQLLVKVGGKRVGILRGTGTHWVALPRKGKVTLTTVNRRKVLVDGFVLTPR